MCEVNAPSVEREHECILRCLRRSKGRDFWIVRSRKIAAFVGALGCLSL